MLIDSAGSCGSKRLRQIAKCSNYLAAPKSIKHRELSLGRQPHVACWPAATVLFCLKAAG